MSTSTLEAPRAAAPQSHAQPKAPDHWIKIASALGKEFKQTASERERKKQLPVAELQKIRESGLANLLIPAKFGGGGGTVRDLARVVVELSKGDASIGFIVALHYMFSSFPRYFDYKGGAEEIERRSARNNWIWSNITAHTEYLEAMPRPEGGYILNGKRAYNTAASIADVTAVLAHRTDVEEVLWAAVPTDRKGLTYHNDWNQFGVTLTDTVTVTFENVVVGPDEVIHSTLGEPQTSFPSFAGTISSLCLAGVSLGSALGALESGIEYARKKKRVNFLGGAAAKLPITQDPFVQWSYGDYWIKLEAALAFLDKVSAEAQDAWDRRLTIPAREIAEITTTRAWAFRVFANNVSLDVANRIFEANGLGSATVKHDFERHWRDIRTVSLHESLHSVQRAVGAGVLTGEYVDYGKFPSFQLARANHEE